MPQPPTFTPEQNRLLRDAANRIFRERYKGKVASPQRAMAEALGITQGGLSTVLRGPKGISAAVAERLAHLDHTTVQQLTGKDPPVMKPADPNLVECLERWPDRWPWEIRVWAVAHSNRHRDSVHGWRGLLDEVAERLADLPDSSPPPALPPVENQRGKLLPPKR